MVVNPVFQRDCFSDRWPENLSQQEEFAGKLAASPMASSTPSATRRTSNPA